MSFNRIRNVKNKMRPIIRPIYYGFRNVLITTEKLIWADKIRTNSLRFRIFSKFWKPYFRGNMENGIYLETVIIYRQIV